MTSLIAALGAVVAASGVLAAASPLDRSAAYLERAQHADGGFAERGGEPNPNLTGWAVLALRAAGRDPRRLDASAEYLSRRQPESAGDLALRILALAALRRRADDLADRLETLRRPNGSIGGLVNSTAWGVLALRAAGRAAGAPAIRYLVTHQRRNGGWSWHPRGAPDTNDTAAVVQALRAASAGEPSVRKAVRYLRRAQNRDGGYGLARGSASDAQSTAWVVQALLAAGQPAPRRAVSYLASLRRRDGSYRHSRRYGFTPVWVTAQVLPALARKPYPVR